MTWRKRDGSKYWVEQTADEGFEGATFDGHSERSIGLDVRIHWREKPDGSRWGSVDMLNPEDGSVFCSMPLADPESIDWMLTDVITPMGWAELDRRAKARKSRKRKRKAVAA